MDREAAVAPGPLPARNEAEVLQDLFDNAPCGYHSLDADGVFLRINDTELRWLGYERGEVVGKKRFSDLLTPRSREVFRAEFPAFKARGYVRHLEFEMVRRDGTVLDVLLNATAVYDARGEFAASRSVVLDLTERRRMERELRRLNEELEARVAARTRELSATSEALADTEEQLRHAQRMEAVGRLAGGVAHDFNNLLSVVLSYAELLQSEVTGDAAADLDEIRKAAERAAGLTRQLLAYSRRQVLDPQPLDAAGVVTGVEAMLRRLIGEDIELALDPRESVGRIHADPGQLEQVILNLALNARDAMPTGGRLVIETASVDLDEEYAEAHLDVTPGPHVVFIVSDTGAGMDAETRQRIFEPFFTTKPRDQGTGLGLATVYGIVKQSGGHIWVYSEPGRGTTFKVYFPRFTGEEAAAPRRSEAPKASRGTETVLLVEDEDLVRRAARSILERRGYAVLEAGTVADALALAEETGDALHLLLTDVIMPRMNGRELAGRIHPHCPNAKVVYMSGYTDDAVVHHGVLEPGIHFIEKPFTPEALARKVREALDGP